MTSCHGLLLDRLRELGRDEDHSWIVTAKATNLTTGEHRWGIASQSKKMLLRDGTLKDDDYALQKALSKAQRNALRAFEPEGVVIEMYKEWKAQRKQDEGFCVG